ncbi:MAG: IPT/TIG domain-containing protein, partial [Thermoanaerobaculales bacterium]|nr:IPT/TIG domain-containing protein [Thermoanaerobaculales bacterium]
MKSFIKCFILCGLVVLVGCGGGSPKPPTVVPPTNGTDVWQITSFEASDASPLVGTAVTVVATVTLNGNAAPDGTQVEFLANGGVFPGTGQQDINVMTADGQASAVFGATESGPYQVQARVKSVTSQITITYEDSDASDGLQIYNINPAAGSYAGGEVVVLTGKGIRAPAEVYFNVQGLEYQAIVDQVVPSNPPSSAGSITLRTPEPTAADSTLTFAAQVKTIVGVGTSTQEQQELPAAFTFIGNTEPPPGVPPTPVLFGVDPYYGRSAGGETVNVIGMDFQWENDGGQTEDTFQDVYFTFQGQDLLAQVERSSATQIEVITPRFSISPLEDDTTAGIKLTRSGEAPIEKSDIFIVMSDVATPEITGISPTAGPMDGGTVVTISGHGFQLPLQVHFGDLEATDIQLYDDTSLADNDIITCVTPDYSQQGQVPPLVVSVTVTNLQSGLSSVANQTFRFGDSLYVGQANPTEGQIGDQFALYGAGFEDPLTVWFRAGGEVEFDVIQVTGTELVLRSPPDMAPTCVDRSGDFRVV